jgi:hypothetical protein
VSIQLLSAAAAAANPLSAARLVAVLPPAAMVRFPCVVLRRALMVQPAALPVGLLPLLVLALLLLVASTQLPSG